MGPLRFELRSEDPQSPRMARLPYGPALLLLAHFIYLSCCDKKLDDRIGRKLNLEDRIVPFLKNSSHCEIIYSKIPSLIVSLAR
jgi:hypothetical protein